MIAVNDRKAKNTALPSLSKGIVQFIVAAVGSAGVIFFLLKKLDLAQVRAAFYGIDINYVVIMLAVSLFGNVIIEADKYRRIVRTLGCNLTLRSAVFIRLGSAPAKFILPGKVGEALKIFYLKTQRGLPLSSGLSTIMFDKYANLTGAAILTIIPAVFYEPLRPYRIPIILIPLIMVTALGASQRLLFLKDRFSNSKLKTKIMNLLGTFSIPPKKVKFALLAYAIFFEMTEFVNTYLVSQALGLNIPIQAIVVRVPLLIIAGSLPFTVSGLGAREAAFILLFREFGEKEILFSAGLLISVIEYALVAILGTAFQPFFLKNAFANKGRRSET